MFGRKRKRVFEVDHVVPLSFGGADDLSNSQVLCHRCHKTKTRAENMIRALRRRNGGRAMGPTATLRLRLRSVHLARWLLAACLALLFAAGVALQSERWIALAPLVFFLIVVDVLAELAHVKRVGWDRPRWVIVALCAALAAGAWVDVGWNAL